MSEVDPFTLPMPLVPIDQADMRARFVKDGERFAAQSGQTVEEWADAMLAKVVSLQTRRPLTERVPGMFRFEDDQDTRIRRAQEWIADAIGTLHRTSSCTIAAPAGPKPYQMLLIMKPRVPDGTGSIAEVSEMTVAAMVCAAAHAVADYLQIPG